MIQNSQGKVVKDRRVMMCRDARYVSSGMASVPVKAIRVLTLGRITRYRDARSVRPLCQRFQHRGFDEDGRTDRASLQRVTRHAGRRRTHRSCVPTAGYTSRFDEDGRTHRSAPTTGYTSRWSETDALSLDTSRAPLQRVTRLCVLISLFSSLMRRLAPGSDGGT